MKLALKIILSVILFPLFLLIGLISGTIRVYEAFFMPLEDIHNL